LLDGAPARSCITYAVACEGAAVTTIEGLDHDEITAELRAAFTREHALQCGYCTPGMLISARDLVLRLADADERQIRIGMSGNLCRCTGYVGIVRAITSVIEHRRSHGIAAQPGGGRRILGPVGSGRGPSGSFGQNRAVSSQAERPARNDRVSDGAIADFTPAHVLEQRFQVAHPADRVFAAFADVAGIASCLPGVVLTAPVNANLVQGTMRVKIGPIVATFQGRARAEQNPADKSGRVIGIGTDSRNRSSTQGEVRYHVRPLDANRAEVELSIGYRLKGMLAQVGRPALVRGLADRIIAEFAGNLDRRLSGAPVRPGAAPAEINALSFFLGTVRGYVTRWFARERKGKG
jgi:carbon-monoxide dehydrogenase small subunit